jgi:transcriptional regulator with XRE-family HTH domain
MDKKALGKRIYLIRNQKGFSQEEVERRLRLRQKSLTQIESGQRFPSTLELSRLAELFYIPIESFLTTEAAKEDPFIILQQIKNTPALYHAVRAWITRLVIQAYKQENISRGRVVELSRRLNLPAQTLFDLAESEG